METKFQPFQRVLVRRNESCAWACDIYSHRQEDADDTVCIGGIYSHCIPYEGNEHLLGTADEPKPKQKANRWRAEKGERYWYVGSYGGVESTTDTRMCTDDCRYAIGNYYRTREEAEAMAEKFKKWMKGGND